MHDYHAVEAVVERLRSAHLEDVTEVRIRAGAAFSPVALRQAYEMLTLGTPLQGSHLLVEPASSECTCSSCEGSWIMTSNDLAGHLILCPDCGAPSPIEDVTSIEIVGISP
jgi:Zn finger protein HypA/HybF involved in hydrogenase expression